MYYRIINKTKEAVILKRAKIAESFLSRLLGLMFKKNISVEEGMIFYYTSSIHTCFMRFPIEVVFLNRDMEAIKVYHKLKPFRLAGTLKCYCIIEMLSCKIHEKAVDVGDVLEIVKNMNV